MARPYKFIHKHAEWIQTNITGKSFESAWLKVENSGKITVKGDHGNGYAWDGCSPKIKLFGKIIGTPDGRIDPKTNKPKTYYASMFHDAIYQFKKADRMLISRKESDIIFKIMLQKSTFKPWKLYYRGVRWGGVFLGKWNSKRTQKGIKITAYSWLENV